MWILKSGNERNINKTIKNQVTIITLGLARSMRAIVSEPVVDK